MCAMLSADRTTESPSLYRALAAACVRGAALDARAHGGRIQLRDPDVYERLLVVPDALLEKPFADMTPEEADALISAGRLAGLKLYRFKRSGELLPRVRRVLGFLRGIAFASLMDVGSGRGAFLWPYLDAFPWADTLCVELLEGRAAFIECVARGGSWPLRVQRCDLCLLNEPPQSRDVVTLLEVLEHIPDVERALSAAVRVARRYVVISVPSKPDKNPEHIHLITREWLTARFQTLGCASVHFDAVPGHLLAFAALNSEGSSS